MKMEERIVCRNTVQAEGRLAHEKSNKMSKKYISIICYSLVTLCEFNGCSLYGQYNLKAMGFLFKTFQFDIH